MEELAVYAALSGSAFLAATILPAQSEAGLALLIAADTHPVAALLFWASLGNVAGSVVNWLLGRQLETLQTKAWFPKQITISHRARRWYDKFGRWSLLLSWMPLIGDPITLVAGVFRLPLLPFLLIVTVAKTGRYSVVALVATQLV